MKAWLCISLIGSALIGLSGAAQAATLYAPTSSVQAYSNAAGDTALGACNFLLSGPSTDPSFTPFRIEGNATILANQVVVSTSLRCRLRTADRYHTQVGDTLTRALPGNTSALEGDIAVNTFAPLQICTMANAVFTDTSELNPGHVETCRDLVSTGPITGG
jgi:hypothetical protein